jgi:DNA polymerase III subunit delta
VEVEVILIWTGDNEFAMAERLAALKQTLQQEWLTFNFQSFSWTDSTFDLRKALGSAQMIPFVDSKRLIVIENCALSSYSQPTTSQAKLLETFKDPQPNILVLIARGIDRRLKHCKALLAQGQHQEFKLPSDWNFNAILTEVERQAKQMSLSLSDDVIRYLAEAIGGNYRRIHTELDKIKLLDPLTLEAVQAAVDCHTQTGWQLAEAVRQGEGVRLVEILDVLLVTEPVSQILGILIAQFRTWLWVKAACDCQQYTDYQIANLCRLKNPKRLFYLKQEVAEVSIEKLVRSFQLIFDLECEFKRTGHRHLLLPGLLNAAQEA